MNFVLDAHCHTISSGHAYSTVTEYITEAASKGLELIAITDHAPKMPGSGTYLHFLNLKVLPKRIMGVELLTGVELNILDKHGNVDLQKSIYKKLDVVIASLHIPCFEPVNEETHTTALINTMKDPFIRIIGHLGDIRYPFDIKKVAQMAKETNTAIEVNDVSLNTENDVRSGGEAIIKELVLECKKQSVFVIMGSDSHFHTYVGDLKYAQKLLDEVDYPPELVLNTSVEIFKTFLKK